MNTLELAKKRRSTRTFDGRPVSQSDLDKIMSFAAEADNPFSQSVSWKLLDVKKDNLTCRVIVGTDTFIAGTMKKAPRAEEAFGWSFEKIALFAESIGVGSTWIAGTMDRAAFERAAGLGEGEVMPCVSPLGYPSDKMSVRETVMRKGIRADTRHDFGDVFFDGDFSKPLTRAKAGELGDAFEAVRLAPSAVNRQPWRVVLDGDSAHFYLKHGIRADGLDVQKIDMGIAMYHFAAACSDIGIETALSTGEPAVKAPDSTEYIASLGILR